MDLSVANAMASPSLSDGSSTPVVEDNHRNFNVEEVTTIIKETVEATITDTAYSHTKVPEWNSTIVDNCLKRLKDMNKNFKYVVTCVIMQKNGAGFYAGSSVYWDNSHDGSANYRFENKSLYAIVNVFGLSV